MATAPTSQSENKSLKWSREKAEEAAKKFEFIRVGGAKNVSTRRLSGAGRSVWPKNPDDVFHTGYRISGKPADVRAALELSQELTPEEIDETMETVITYGNHTVPDAQGGMKEEYDNEIANYEAWKNQESQTDAKKKSKKSFTTQYTLPNAVWFAANLKTAQVVTKDSMVASKTAGKTTKVAKGAKTAAKTGKGGKAAPLLQRIQEATTAGKVVDVTEMGDQGTGARTKPKPGNKSKLLHSSHLPGLASETVEKYTAALRMLPGGEAAYHEALTDVRAQCQAKTVGKPVKPAVATRTVPGGSVPGVMGTSRSKAAARQTSAPEESVAPSTSSSSSSSSSSSTSSRVPTVGSPGTRARAGRGARPSSGDSGSIPDFQAASQPIPSYNNSFQQGNSGSIPALRGFSSNY